MTVMQDYTLALWGLWIMAVTVLVQGVVAAMVKASRPGAIPGKIDESLSHDSFVFRAHRTFMNSLENMPGILAAVLVAVLGGADPLWTGVLVWAFALARIIHMALYYMIATEKNPSPRSYFFLIGLIANIALLIVAAWGLV